MVESKINYVQGSFDILRAKTLDDLDRQIQIARRNGAGYFAVGIYDDELCENLGMGQPLKKVEDRMKIMEQIRGVDFVFRINTLDKRIIKEKLEERYKQFIEENRKKENPTEEAEKENEYGYAPGTYDLFHAGHLEHLLIASSRCKKLIVGVKTDELVREHKHKETNMTTEERIGILRHFKFVHDVYPYHTRDLSIAVDWIRSKYGDKELVVFYGSDLEEDFKNTEIRGVRIVFTPRDEEKKKTRSTTVYTLRLNSEKNRRYTSKTPLAEIVGIGVGEVNIDDSEKQITQTESTSQGEDAR